MWKSRKISKCVHLLKLTLSKMLTHWPVSINGSAKMNWLCLFVCETVPKPVLVKTSTKHSINKIKESVKV